MSSLLAALLLAGVAQAQPLRWDAPAGCPGAADVQARAERLLEGSSRASYEAPALDAAVRETESGLRLTLRSAGGVREIEGHSCETLADAAALIAAMAIDPDAVAAAQLAESAPPAAAAEPTPRTKALGALLNPPVPGVPSVRAAARPAAVVSVGSDPKETTAGRWSIGVGVAGDLGGLPGVAVGPSIAGGLELGALRIDARVWLLPEQEARLENHATAAGAFSMIGGELRACAVALRGSVELAPCAGLSAARVGAAGRGVSSPGSSSAFLPGVVAGGQIALPLADWLALRADLAAVVALARPAFVIDGIDGVVHRPAAVSGRLSVMGEVRFR